MDFVSGCCPCSYVFFFWIISSYVFRGSAFRFSYSLGAYGFVLFFSCLLGNCPFGNKFLIIQKQIISDGGSHFCNKPFENQ